MSPAAGRLQTIVLIPLSCSLPTNLPDYHPCSSSPFVSAGLPSQNRAANRRKRKKREREGLLTCWLACSRSHTKPPGAHAIWHSHTHTRIHTNTQHIYPLCCIHGLLSSLFAFILSQSIFSSFTLSLSLSLESSSFHLPLYPLTFFEPHVCTSSVNPPTTPTHTHTHTPVCELCLWTCERCKESEECSECIRVCVFVFVCQ